MLWGKPGNAQKFHIFSGTRSLCMKWFYSGADQEVKAEQQVAASGDCKECVKRYNKHITPHSSGCYGTASRCATATPGGSASWIWRGTWTAGQTM